MVVDLERALSLDGVSVDYHIFQRKRKWSLGGIEVFTALEDITFDVEPGEIVAVLGKNGSGKTTLLRAIGGHLRVSKGCIKTNGKVYTLSGANPGLAPDLSGKENVRLLSEVYGVPEDMRLEFENEVEEFCDLGEAYYRRYKTLSTGMAGRVGFGFTTSLDPEILLMDETLGVGDEEFRKKAEAKAKEFMERGETILLSTHSLGLAKKMCSRGIVLDSGRVSYDGDISEAIKRYLEIVNRTREGDEENDK